jgi:predicted membrane GTPase involved in stress response
MTARLLSRLAARAEFRRGATMLHPECPVEQTVRGRVAPVQAQLLQEIWRRHSFIADAAMFVAEPNCLRVLARTERALAAPVEALRRRYGADVVVEPASVRYVHGAPVLEPFMNVLVTGPARHLQFVQSDLGQRRGAMTRVDQRAGVFVIEAEAPLGHLLGYGDRLDERFDGSVEASIWLSRYCPIAGDGPYAA